MAQVIQGPDARDVTDFKFRQMSRYQIQNDEMHLSNIPKSPIQRLSVANKFGRIFAGCYNSLITISISELERQDDQAAAIKAASQNKTSKELVGDSSVRMAVPLPSTPTHLGVNADETSLAVALTHPLTFKPHIYIFDTRGLVKKMKM